jgi:hypothetical protein
LDVFELALDGSRANGGRVDHVAGFLQFFLHFPHYLPEPAELAFHGRQHRPNFAGSLLDREGAETTDPAAVIEGLAPATPTYTIGAGASLGLLYDRFDVPLVNNGTLTALFSCGGCTSSAILNSTFTNNGLVNLMGGENLVIPNNGLDNYGTIQSLAGSGLTAVIQFLSGPGTLTNHLGGTLRSNGSATSNMLVTGFAGVVNEGVIDVLAPMTFNAVSSVSVDSTTGTKTISTRLSCSSAKLCKSTR